MNTQPLDKIKEIIFKDNVVYVIYDDNTKQIIKNNVKFVKGLTNENNSPIIDHCI